MRKDEGKQDLLVLAGWLFADLFIVLAVIFIASTTMNTPKRSIIPMPVPTPTSVPTPLPTMVVKDPTLNPKALEVELTGIDVNNLLGHGPVATKQIEDVVIKKLQEKNATQLTAGIVLIFGGGPDDGQDTRIAIATHEVLLVMGKRENLMFNDQTVFRNFIDRANPRGTITIEIYVFNT